MEQQARDKVSIRDIMEKCIQAEERNKLRLLRPELFLKPCHLLGIKINHFINWNSKKTHTYIKT